VVFGCVQDEVLHGTREKGETYPMAELDALVDETAETLLNAIKASAEKTSVPRHLLSLAQAYALVVAPGSALAPAETDDSD
jgi:hypothetical protein